MGALSLIDAPLDESTFMRGYYGIAVRFPAE
jgi:hypothetical protein